MDPAAAEQARFALGAAFAAIFAGAVLFVAWGAALSRSGASHRLGTRLGDDRGAVIEWSGREGFVRAGGEVWRAVSAAELSAGDAVRVVSVRGLLLEVEPQRPETAPEGE